MKININQVLYDVDGTTPIRTNGTNIPMTLKDVCIGCLLTPVQAQYDEQGKTIQRADNDREKLEKWDIFKKFRDAAPTQTPIDSTEIIEIELRSEEIILLKKWLGYFQPQLIFGQCVDMLEK